jgi:predicted neutral ceramidase superfamily lipid hydrolase
MSIVTRPRSEAEVNAIVASIRKVTKEITKDKKTARDFLVKHGYVTKTGKLTKRYGG